MEWQTQLTDIQHHLNSGGVVQTVTYARATNYSKKHRDWCSADASGLYVRHGKGKVCLNFTHMRFGHDI
jgi:hypothetical protein